MYTQAILESAAVAAAKAAARDFRGALAALLGCGPLLRALNPSAHASSSDGDSDDSGGNDGDENDSRTGDAEEETDSEGNGGGGDGNGGGGGGAMGVLRALVHAPGAAEAAVESLLEAGVDEDLAGRVEEALSLPFDSMADLVCTRAHECVRACVRACQCIACTA